jgi:hypothetical protein
MAIRDNLRGYWKLNEASWDGTSGEVVDSSAGNATTTATGALLGRSGTFDGTGDKEIF